MSPWATCFLPSEAASSSAAGTGTGAPTGDLAFVFPKPVELVREEVA